MTKVTTLPQKRRRVTSGTGHRLVRAAYEYEHLASVMRSEGHDAEASGVLAIAGQLGKIGRGLLDKMGGR